MKKISSLLALAGLLVTSPARADALDNIQLWVGSGTNSAGFEIDWNNGAANSTLVWGYRWDGTATGEQMFDAIIAADPRLYAEVSGSTAFGTAVFGLGFHPGGDQNFPLSPDLNFNGQHLAILGDYSDVNDNRTAVNAGDLWQEGWFSAGYWSYYTSTDDRLSADWTDWDYSGVGMSSHDLENGDFDGWSFAYDFSGPPPATPFDIAPVPEPATWALFGLSGLFLVYRRKNYPMKKISVLAVLTVTTLLTCLPAKAISLDDIPVWTGAGTNRAALVIEWNSPEVFNNTTVPAPVTEKTLVWGYRFNGSATATEMLKAVLAADPKLYIVADDYFGSTFVNGIGYNLTGNGTIGITDGTITNYFNGGFLLDSAVDLDASHALNPGDLFWNSSGNGPYWQVWNESGDAGGFMTSPNRGANPYWDADSYTHGQWASAFNGIDDLPLTDGSWIGFSVSAAGYDANTNDPAYNAFNFDEQAPPSPDGTYVAYVADTNDFAIQIVSTNNVYATSPYNDPTAILNRPTLNFLDYLGDGDVHRSKIIEPPYWTDADGNDVITEIAKTGQITVKLGRKIYDDPNNPYGVDLIVYGNSFFTAGHLTDFVDDGTDLNVATLSAAPNGSAHPTAVSVSQDGTNWFTYPTVPYLFSAEAYRWDDTNSSWTAEEMNPTKPLNPLIYTNNFSGQTVANGLDQYLGASGGSGFDLQASGLPWIQYVRVAATSSTYTVIDAIAAANPVAVGDALSISPDNLASGITSLKFQNPGNLSQNQLTLHFDFVNANAKINTASLSEFSAFAPVTGTVSSAYQIAVKPVTGTNTVTYLVDIGLRAGGNYSGNGNDLRVYQWGGTNWTSQPFSFNPTNNEALVAGVTNFSAFVVAQIVAPQIDIQSVTSGGTNGFAFQFTPVPNCAATLERSGDLITWTPIHTFTATNAQPITLQDFNVPADKAFYRVRLNP